MPSNKAARLPLGLQSFSEVRKLNCAYVDKTPMAVKLANEGKFYFLARPRRFGKSLFLDTLRNMFEGKSEWFQGLYAENNWQWKVKYPVIKLDITSNFDKPAALDIRLLNLLENNAIELGIDLRGQDAPTQFNNLIMDARRHYGQQAVLLIDEYDKPMLDNIGNPRLARQMRDTLHGFYSIIKTVDEHLRFVLLTGVSKFAKVSIFSGLNNIEDISLNPDYGSICGYTEEDLGDVFGGHLQGADRDQLRYWYNGYNFLGTKRVYNPYDILNFIKDSRSFGEFYLGNHWFETGTPTFVIDLIARDKLLAQQLEPQIIGKHKLDSSSLDKLELTTALLQSGYLTIDSVDRSDPSAPMYQLVCPNHSVRSALHNNLFEYQTGSDIASFHTGMYRALRDAQLANIEAELKRLFASIAADNYRKNDIARFEGHYASVVYSFFFGMGLRVTPEDVASLGRIDLVIQIADNTYVLEFKVVKRKSKVNSALKQIIERAYAAKYSGNIYQIGIEFSETKRNIVGFAWQRCSKTPN